MPQEISPSVSSPSLARPKVFISYSWTSPGHQAQVRQWAERLLSDGIEVVVDIFDLKEGQDKYHFMERMVTDRAISHVLVMCDHRYAAKADAKKDGVGTESQIISSEVYAKVEQSKFIPIVCEFSDQSEPCLPTFLRSRIWIDFSSSEAVNQNWEKLVRLLHGKPAYQKPEVGKPPAYINEVAGAPVNPAVGKLATLKQALISNAKGLSSYRQDFLSACIQYADNLRVRKNPGLDTTSFAKKILEDCGKLRGIRNQIVDWVLLESGEPASDHFQESLLTFLEELRELKSRPEEIGAWNENWFEGHSVFVYETFLYIVAALMKTGAYGILHEVFTSHYLRPKSERYGAKDFDTFGSFCGYSDLLQLVLAPERQTLHSPAAELIKIQADRSDLPFTAIMEAELVVMLMAFISPDVHWRPQTFLYNSQVDFPFFVRAAQHRHFVKLATITGIADAHALREAAKIGYERLEVDQWRGFYMLNRNLLESMNLGKLDTLK